MIRKKKKRRKMQPQPGNFFKKMEPLLQANHPDLFEDKEALKEIADFLERMRRRVPDLGGLYQKEKEAKEMLANFARQNADDLGKMADGPAKRFLRDINDEFTRAFNSALQTLCHGRFIDMRDVLGSIQDCLVLWLYREKTTL